MFVLLVLLACLLSILVITLFRVESINHQVIVFEIVVILLILFKLIFGGMIHKNKNNTIPLSKNSLNKNVNILDNVNMDVHPVNYNLTLNSPTPNNVMLNNILNHSKNNNNQTNLLNNTNIVDNTPLPNISNDVLNAVEANELVNHLGNNLNNLNKNHGCLLDSTPCKNITQNESCCMSNNDSKSVCSACPFSENKNGNNVSDECLKNNDLNYQDVLNVDNSENNKANTRDCATDNSCVINSDNTNLHIDSPYNVHTDDNRLVNNSRFDSKTVMPNPDEVTGAMPDTNGPHPGDPEFADVKDFWKLKVNNSDLCYIKRVLPKYFCHQ